MSYSAIAKDVGLSEAAVRHRVQKLIEGGVIQIVAVTDPMQMGFARQAMIGIKVTGDVQEVAAKLGDDGRARLHRHHDGTLRHPRRAGGRRATTSCSTSSRSRSARSRASSATETFVYMRLVKQTYAWGVI